MQWKIENWISFRKKCSLRIRNIVFIVRQLCSIMISRGSSWKKLHSWTMWGSRIWVNIDWSTLMRFDTFYHVHIFSQHLRFLVMIKYRNWCIREAILLQLKNSREQELLSRIFCLWYEGDIDGKWDDFNRSSIFPFSMTNFRNGQFHVGASRFTRVYLPILG